MTTTMPVHDSQLALARANADTVRPPASTARASRANDLLERFLAAVRLEPVAGSNTKMLAISAEQIASF